mgnify:CR=1 FL=1
MLMRETSRIGTVLAAVALLLVISSPLAAQDWYDSSWSDRQRIVFSANVLGIASDQTDYPLLVQLDDATNELFAVAQATGQDVLFTAADGVTKLAHELEHYDAAGGSEALTAWVRLPTVSASEPTNIYMYYGNPSAEPQETPHDVWDEQFIGVWHLTEDGNDSLYEDSTINGLQAQGGIESTGISGNPAPVRTEAFSVIGAAQGFDTDNDGAIENRYIRLADENDPWGLTGTQLTMSIWFHLLDRDNDYRFISKSRGGPEDQHWFMIGMHGATDQFRTRLKTTEDSITFIDGPALVTDNWYHGTMVWDGSTVRLYLDGVEVGSQPLGGTLTGDLDGDLDPVPPPYPELNIGTGYDGNRAMPGYLDEARISTAVRSPDWVKTQYEMQKPSAQGVPAEPYENDAAGFIKRIEAQEQYGGYAYRRQIVLDKNEVAGTTDLSDFPAAIRLQLDPTKVESSNGYDVAFADVDGTWLSHEIDSYDSSTGEYLAWVKVPTLSVGSDTRIFAYYGSPDVSSGPSPAEIADVWSNGYLGVYHFRDASWTDSTNQYSGTAPGGSNDPTIEQNGRFGSAVSLDGIDDYIEIADVAANDAFDFGTDFAISGFIRPDSWSVAETAIVSKGNDGWRATADDGPSSLRFTVTKQTDGDEDLDGAGAIQPGEWTYFSMVQDYTVFGGERWIYRNGRIEARSTFETFTDAINQNDQPVWIGANSGLGGRHFDGLMDEIRVSETERSEEWVQTEYNNLRDLNAGAGRFIKSIGPEESVGWWDEEWSHRRRSVVPLEGVALPPGGDGKSVV